MRKNRNGQYQSFLILLFSILLIPSFVYAQLSMVDVATTTGIAHQYPFSWFGYGGGVSFYDFNNDGWDDLSFATNGDSIHFYQNIFGSFQKVDLGIGIGVNEEVKQILWVDQDNDGDMDLFITEYLGSNHLFENDGNMNFVDITGASGILQHSAPTYGAAWGDVNNDGYLDLYITNRVLQVFPFCNYLYLNNGDDTFTNITWSAGVSDSLKAPFVANFIDYDRDGSLDIYIPQDKDHGNVMFKNQTNNTFLDVSAATNSNVVMVAMSGTIEDFDANGFPDIYMTDGPPCNKLLVNSGLGDFTEESVQRNVCRGLHDSWGANWFDLENDGDLDLHVCGTDVILPDTQHTFYIQDIPGYFNLPYAVQGYDTARSRGAAIGDFNNDGRVDVAMNNEAPSYSMLLQNNSVSGHWLNVDLEGTISNKDGVGSIIETWVNGNYQARYTLCGESYISQNSGTEFFGFGTAFTIDSLKVIWPSGIVDVEYGIDTDQRISMIEGIGLLSTFVSQPSLSAQLYLFPQPATDLLNIVWANKRIQTIQIFDRSGRALSISSEIQRNRAFCNIEHLPNGLYFLSVTSEKGEAIAKKFIKIDRY